MFMHNKRLQYTVRVGEPNPKLATFMLEQFGGADGELAAAMRYFTQGLGEDDPGRKDMLLDIATEELSHLEVIGSIVAMLMKGAKAQLAEGALEEAELYRTIGATGTSAKESVLFGGGPALIDSAGVPWTAAYIDSRGEPTVDLRSNIAAEARAKIVYERLINITDDPGVKEALGFLMTREVAHQKSFEKALYSIEDNFPRASCRESSGTRTYTSTRRRAMATRPAPGIRVRNGIGSTIWRRPCRSTVETEPRRWCWARPTLRRSTGWRRGRCRIPPPIRPPEPISAPVLARAG